MDLREQLQATLGDAYTVERELGGGGMSRVYVAEDTRLRRKVVVKVLSPELAQGLSAERFEREVHVAASLQQANIVPVLSAGDAGGLPYFTMPYVEGESLRARLRDHGPLPIAQVVKILGDVTRALAYAHDRGVVHRDIKPDNVLLSGGTAVVTDFGIAKALAAAKRGERPEGRGPKDLSITALTSVGTSIGTPAYMAPEQAAGDPNTDARADFYALGCTAFELLTGRPPFDARTPQQLFAAHLTETPRPVNELRADTPASLVVLVARCLAKNPDDRPRSATEIIHSLDGIMPNAGTAASLDFRGGAPVLWRALGLYVAAFVILVVATRAAVVSIGLPDWVVPGTVAVMLLGLPAILLTAYVVHVSRRSLAATPTRTPGGSLTAPGTQGAMASLALKASPHVSWRRTTKVGLASLTVFVVAVAAYMVMRVFGIGPAASLFSTGALSSQDRIVVADFDASGGIDSTLGGAIAEAARTDLRQSRAVNVLPLSRVSAILKFLGRDPTTKLGFALARDVAQRDGAKAVLGGTVTSMGASFVVTMRLVDAKSGDELTSLHETAKNPDALMETIGHLSRRLRGKIGESLKSVQGSPPLWQVSTTSMEAFKKAYEGVVAWVVKGDAPTAIAAFDAAVRIDSTFATAWTGLALLLRNSGVQSARSAAALQRAYDLRGRLPEAEREFVTASYLSEGPHADRRQSVDAYNRALQGATRDSGFLGAVLNDFAVTLANRREFARAESLYRRSSALDTTQGLQYGNLLTVLIHQGKLSAAESLGAVMKARVPGYAGTYRPARELPYHRGQVDSAAAVAQRQLTSNSATVRAAAAGFLANIARLRGRLAEWERTFADFRARNAERGAIGPPGIGDSLTAARVDALFREQPAKAVVRSDAVLASDAWRALPPSDRPYFAAVTAYTLAGRPDRARVVLAALDADIKDTAWHRLNEPQRHTALGDIALAEGKARDAIREFRRGDSLPDGPATSCTICLHAALGRAYDLANLPDSAIAEFERYIATPYSARLAEDSWWLAGTHKRLGELYEAKGDRQRAATHYAKFIALWNTADAELQPKVQEAKRKLQRLSDAEVKR